MIPDKEKSSSPMRKRLFIALAITASIAIGELVGGILSNSLALIGDAGHMFTDVLAISLSLLAFSLARRPPDQARTYGLLRAEILAALANGAILLFVAIFIIYEGISRLEDAPDVDASIMLPVATIGLVANIGGALILKSHAASNLNIKGAFFHMLSDAASSVAVIVGGALIALTGEHIFDPLASFVIAALIMRGSIHLLSQSANILVESVPPHIDLQELTEEIIGRPNVTGVHDIHVWTITSNVYALSGHLVVGDRMIGECSLIIEEINNFLKIKYQITHTTWQLECGSCPDDDVCKLNDIRK